MSQSPEPENWAEKLIRFLVERTQLLGVMIAVAFTIFGLLGFGVVAGIAQSTEQNRRLSEIIASSQTRTDEAREIADRQRDLLLRATQCILYQLSEHRIANKEAHGLMADILGTAVATPPDLPPDLPAEKVKAACEVFYQKANGQ